MARIRSILGVIEGSAGSVTFSSTAGVNLMRQKVGKNNSKSPAQVSQRAKFAEIGLLAKAFGSVFLGAGYKRQGFQSGSNQFVSQNIAYVSLDQDNVGSVDYSKVSVSSGGVTPLDGLTMAAATGGKAISWADNSDGNQALASDKVYVAIVRTGTMQVVESLGTKTRADKTVTLQAAYIDGIAAGELAVYAFATRQDNSDASPSVNLATASSGTPAPTYSNTLTGPSDNAQGVTLTASAGDKLGFDALTSGSSAPANMTIAIGGNQVASVDYLDRYNGKPFSFTHNGAAHTGSFANTVNF